MIDFKKINDDRCMSQGYCDIPDRKMPKISAIRRDCASKKQTRETINWKLARYGDKVSIEFLGAPTGYESYWLETIADFVDSTDNGLCICAGSDRYDHMKVSGEELRAILRDVLSWDEIKSNTWKEYFGSPKSTFRTEV